MLSRNGIRVGVADDIRPYNMDRYGYQTEIHRGGVIVYS
jgi:hypothetical protein